MKPVGLHPYLLVGGNYREVMEFYKTIFGSELMRQKFGGGRINKR